MLAFFPHSVLPVRHSHGAFSPTGETDNFFNFRKGKSIFLEMRVVRSNVKPLIIIMFPCNHALNTFIVLDQNQFLQ